MKRVRRGLIWVVLVAFSGGVLASLAVGELLTRPASRRVGAAPADLPTRVVEIPVVSGERVFGWWVPGDPGKGAVLLLHGIRSDRSSLVGRARFLHRAGYSVLMLDLPAHGESDGSRITFGALEAEGVAVAVQFLRRERPGERVGVIGSSLGAASVVLARLSPRPDAVVLEAMYPTIEEALANRLTQRLGAWSAVLVTPLLWQLPLRTGVRPDQLRPIERLGRLGAPVLIASGSDDRHTTWAETERLFAAAAAHKELWRVDGAAHEDLHAFHPERYEEVVLNFLGRFLATP